MKKLQKKYTITVGIPTLNEEHNIANLLRMLRKQTHTYAEIIKIHIVDDGSKDNTIANIAKVKDTRIEVTQRSKRLGQTSAQNYIFEHAKTDFVLIIEADTFPKDNKYVDNIIQPFLKDTSIGLIQGNMKPLPSTSLLGRILNTQFRIYTKFVINNDRFSNPITSGRGGRLFAKSVYTKLRWPNAVPEDDYAHLWCKKYGIRTAFSREALSLYQRPQILVDYLYERKKINGAALSINKHFSKEVIGRYFVVPLNMQIQMTLYFMVRYPLTFLCYCGLVVLQTIITKGHFYTDFWPETRSTKQLFNLVYAPNYDW